METHRRNPNSLQRDCEWAILPPNFLFSFLTTVFFSDQSPRRNMRCCCCFYALQEWTDISFSQDLYLSSSVSVSLQSPTSVLGNISHYQGEHCSNHSPSPDPEHSVGPSLAPWTLSCSFGFGSSQLIVRTLMCMTAHGER